jgi:cysteine desulfurase
MGILDLDGQLKKLAALREYAAARLPAAIGDGALILPETAAPHILNLAVPGIRSQVLVSFLESRDIFVSAGSACSRGRRSHVLEAMGLDPKRIDCSIRISFSSDNSPEDIDALCEGLAEARKQLI